MLIALFNISTRPERFELPTTWFVARYSIQLSYGRNLYKKPKSICKRYFYSNSRGIPERLTRVHPVRSPAAAFSCPKMQSCIFVELPTTWFVARYSIQLSYGRIELDELYSKNTYLAKYSCEFYRKKNYNSAVLSNPLCLLIHPALFL